jgi:hypothetical protein
MKWLPKTNCPSIIRVCMLLTGFIKDYHGASISCWIFICQLVLQMVTSALYLSRWFFSLMISECEQMNQAHWPTMIVDIDREEGCKESIKHSQRNTSYNSCC